MTPALLLPIALAALAALILPLLIHLARRSEQRPTDFAALRWLRQKPKPRHRIHFDERLLLLLRLLLLALLALLLAQPVLYGAQNKLPWLVIAPSVDVDVAMRDIQSAEFQRHWLAPGFPKLDSAQPAPTQPIASLLRELDSSLPPGVALTVMVPRSFDGADGGRVQLSRRVDWQVVDGVGPGQSDSPKPVPAFVAPQIRYSADRASALPYLRAAMSAWNDANVPNASDAYAVAPVEQAFDSKGRSLIWLAPGPVPEAVRAWVKQGGSVLIDAESRWPGARFDAPLWRDADGRTRVVATSFGRGRVMRLTGALSPRDWPQMLQPGFAGTLRQLFETADAQPGRVFARDYTPASGGASYALPPMDMRPWLALLIALLFLGERWLATGARRGGAP